MRLSYLRLKARTWVVLGVVVGVTVALPWIARSRFVAELRAASLVRRAQAHLAARELDGARRDLRAALRLQPDAADPRHQLAVTELSLGDWDLAFLEFQTLTEMHPEDPRGWIGLADLMLRTGLLAPPDAALDSAVDADLKRADARRIRGDVRLRLGRYHGALIDAEAAVAGAPKDAAAWALLVRSAARSRGVDAGIEAARRGIAAVGQAPAVVNPLAWLLAEQGHGPDAAAMLQEAIRVRGDPAARLTLARVELRENDPQAARRELDELLSQRPADEEALALHSIVDAAVGEVEPSLAQLSDAVQLLPRSRLLRELQASVNAAQKDRAAVAALVADTVGRELGPAPAPSARIRAEARMAATDPAVLGREHWPGRLAQMRQALEVQLRQQSWSDAQRVVDSARRTYPDTAFAAFLGGILELARGNPTAAETQLSESLSASPRSPVILAALAKTWSRRNGASFAGDRALRVAEQDPPFAFARYLAARAYMDGHDPARAEAALKGGLVGKAGSPASYGHLASFDLELDRAADAADVCRQGVQRFPENVALQMSLAKLAADLGNPSEAIQAYEGILSRRPDLDLVEYRLGSLLASSGKDAPPSPRLRQILQDLQADRPSDPALLDALGWMHARAGETARARELLQAAVKAAPDEPSTRFHLAAVYMKESQAVLARAELRAALDSARSFPERLDAIRLLRESADDAKAKPAASDPAK
ncbi:MAG: tetratricopeptide repeat protein [Myxococcaceae bacterium]